MVHDDLNGIIYVGSTDFTSYGRVYVMQEDGTILSNFTTGISPGSFGLDIRKTIGITNHSIAASTLTVSPNPASDYVTWRGTGEAVITDILGRVVLTQKSSTPRIDVTDLQSGLYFIETSGGIGRFVKH